MPLKTNTLNDTNQTGRDEMDQLKIQLIANAHNFDTENRCYITNFSRNNLNPLLN